MRAAVALTVLVAAGLVSSLVVLPALAPVAPPDREVVDAAGAEIGGVPAAPTAGTVGETDGVSLPSPDFEAAAALAQEDAVERGVDEGIALVQSQGVEVSQQQRAAALEGARASVVQHQEADVEQIQAATTGAVHGALVQEQGVNVTQLQAAVGGATGGALAQHQRANATQLQSATWGAAHGTVAQTLTQRQTVTVEQIQTAASGAAAGAAHEAGQRDVAEVGKIQEAAQGSSYGVLEQYQKLTVEQRQRVTLEHAQHAAAGAAAGALEGSSRLVLEQEQRVEIEQYQRVTIKQVQSAAMGAAKGAIVQQQRVTVEQTQSAARGAAAGSLIQLQFVRVEQVQRITIAQLQEAAFGASKGAIVQSQEATVEQIQAAARGAAGGTLVQQQTVSVTQVQWAATGAAKGAVESAIQEQVVEVEQIQAAARGAGEGAVTQVQVVNVLQVQILAQGASSGALSQAQTATVEQIQSAARGACEAAAAQTQFQRVAVTQLQTLTADTAANAAAYAADAGLEEEAEIADYAATAASEAFEEVDERTEIATVTVSDQESDGERVAVDRVELSDGGFVAIHDETFADDPVESVRGVSEFLEPGTHEDVEIDLEEPLAESQSVLAVAHLETTGDDSFDYVESDGVDDEPYVDETGAVVADRTTVALAVDAPPEEALEDELEVPAVEEDEPDLEAPPEPNGPEEPAEPAAPDEPELEEPEESEEDFEEPEEDSEEPEEPEPEESDEPTEPESQETPETPAEPEATLEADDQVGDGDELIVDSAGASVEYALVAFDETGEELAASEPLPAGETVENATLELDPPLESGGTLEVAVVAATEADTPGDDPVLASQTIEYALAASLAFEDQESDGRSVVVDEADLPEGGFVTVHDERLLEALEGGQELDETTNETLRESALGVSEFLEPGAHEDVEIDLFDVPGLEFEGEALAEGERPLVAVAFQDADGDETFGFVETAGDTDGPYVDAEGAPVAEAALVAVTVENGVGEVPDEEEETEAEEEIADEGETADEEETADEGESAFVAVTDLSAPEQAAPGETISVTATITNEGDLAETAQVVYRIDDEAVGDSTVRLEAGESIELTFTVPIPATALEGPTTHAVETADDEAAVTIDILPPEAPAAGA